jgi:hypothetical protein
VTDRQAIVNSRRDVKVPRRERLRIGSAGGIVRSMNGFVRNVTTGMTTKICAISIIGTAMITMPAGREVSEDPR